MERVRGRSTALDFEIDRTALDCAQPLGNPQSVRLPCVSSTPAGHAYSRNQTCMSTPATKYLYQLPRMSIIRGFCLLDGTPADVIFDRPDGQYSFCYLASDRSKLLHLHVMTELQPDGDAWVLVPKIPIKLDF